MRIPRRLRPYLPNSSSDLVLTPRRAPVFCQPVHLTQIIGGKTWSLSIVRNNGGWEPLSLDDLRAEVEGEEPA